MINLCFGEPLLSSLPVNDIPDGAEVFGFAIFVLEVVLYIVSTLMETFCLLDLPRVPKHQHQVVA